MSMDLTQEILRRWLRYDPETGNWTWIKSSSRSIKVGQVAGSLRQDGYRRIFFDGVFYYSARLAFFYMTGEWPKEQMDHINKDRDDDRWVNLREASSSDNNANRKMQSNNTSGYRGVSWDYMAGKWDVRVNRIHIGFFDDIEEAVAARDLHAEEMQGAFANLNSFHGELQ